MSETLTAADYEAVLADHRRLVRELDVALNGEHGAAKQASLCDLIAQVKQCVLVPKGGEWSVGNFDLDTWEGFEGTQGLMIELTKEQCRQITQQLL